MRVLAMAVVVLVSGAASQAQVETRLCAPGPLDGTWVVLNYGYTPSKDGDATAKKFTALGRHVEIANDRMKALDKDSKGYSIGLKLTEASGLAFQVDKDGPWLPGSYRMEDGCLTIAVGLNGKCPSNFEPSTTALVIVLKQPIGNQQ